MRLRTGTSFIMGLLVGALALGAGIAVAHNDGTEIRITAMRHESDGRIEFAVQERDGESWGERVLPRARFFPASGREGRWLNSTPITVGVVESLEAPMPTVTPTPIPPASIETDAPERVDILSETEITVTVLDGAGAPVGPTNVSVRLVEGRGLVLDAGEPNTDACTPYCVRGDLPPLEETENGQTQFSFLAPVTTGDATLVIVAGDVREFVTLEIGSLEAPTQSAWYYTREVDPLTDEVKTFAQALATETTHSSGYTFGTASVTLRCSGNRFEAYVSWGYSLFGNDEDEILVKWRADQESLQTEYWGESTDNKAAFSPSPRAIARSLVGASTLIVEGREQSSYSNDVVRGTFPVTGLDTSQLHCW